MISSNKKLQKKIEYMGLNFNYKIFNIMRIIGSLILFIFLLFFIDYGYIVAPIATIAYYVFVEYVILDLGIKRRIKTLEEDALEFIPVFMISLKSGRNIKNAISISTEIVNNDLSLEFKKVLNNVQLGKSLDESLNILKSRMPSEILNNIIISIMEANRLGNNINESVNIQLDYIREKKNKGIINKYKMIPLKLAIFSIVFVFIVLLLLMIFEIFI